MVKRETAGNKDVPEDESSGGSGGKDDEKKNPHMRVVSCHDFSCWQLRGQGTYFGENCV